MVGTNSSSYNATAVGSYYVVISCGNCKDTSNVINITVGPCTGSCSNYNPLKVIGSDIGGPANEIAEPDPDAVLAYSILINPPVASPCNVVTFSANYNFSFPHSPQSGVFWNFGDGFGATSSWAGMSGTSTASPHTYTTPGIYVVSALMYSNCPPPPTPHICPVLDTIHYVVPVAANFGYNVNCNLITLSDLSTTLPSLGCNISSWAWTVSGPAGATFNNPATQNPVFTVTQSGTYNITLLVTSNCGGCQATVTYPVSITIPSATFTPPSPICALTAAPFTVTNTPGFSYNWNFGDGYQSNLASTNHAFAAPPPNTSLVTLTVTDAMGCTATSSQTVTILPPLTVSIPTDKYICPGASFTLTTTPASFTNYQWYFNGNPISGATNPTYNASNIGEYYVIVNNGTGCIAKSNKMHIWHHPKPIADIKGQTIQCITGGTGNIYLYNAITDPNYSFVWTVNPTATFSPNNTQYDANVTVNATGTYQFILTVTNIVTGCIAKDTFCVYVYNNPSVAIGPTGYLCEGVMHTYNVISPNVNYVYQWNNGITGTSMTTAQAGNYYVTVLDPVTGCNAQSNMVTIKPRPYVVLFPIGCDTLCDTAKLIPPLPLGPGQNYNGVYVIQWYVDGNYHSTGPVLNLNLLTLGQHQIYIVVNFIGDTCAATSGKYDLFIKHCGDCDCKESHWGETKLTEGEKVPAKDAKAAPVKTGQVNPPAVIGNPIVLNCGIAQKLDCNKTYTISSSYICKDSACAGKVTFSLQPPVGSPITGTNTITFTTNQTGTYILTMYGWCGGKICDTCVIDLVVDCKKCDCKGSKWGEKTYTIDKSTKSLNCDKNKTIDVKCKQPVTVNANYLCAGAGCNAAVTYSLQPPTGTPQTGTLPLTFIPNQTGIYTVTMYGWCGSTLCDSCVIRFKTECDSSCCDYEIKAEPKEPTYIAATNSTIVSNNFAISIPAIANITEVRANVVSYTITDNFNKECMKCVNLPFTWASASTATNINTAPPKITMYGGTTVPAFNGSGAGAYQNPREIIWNNGTNLNSPNITNIGMSFILPAASAIDCCELKGRICVKFIFRDNDCKECEVIACFDFVIRKK
ncbi:MAG TPA: PKD domain-containing protein, partial [Ferruginibacter sp.]|nr:PKD domain-containing protein [Ferruginibacter sp.]